MLLAVDEDPMRIVMACAVVIVILLIGAALVMYLRKKMWGPDTETEPDGGGFTLGDLRKLHKTGRMTDAEFEVARNAMVAAAQRAAQRETKKDDPPRRRPPRDPGLLL